MVEEGSRYAEVDVLSTVGNAIKSYYFPPEGPENILFLRL